jgi:hypothetical protein
MICQVSRGSQGVGEAEEEDAMLAPGFLEG